MLIISILIDIVLNFVLIVKFLFFCYDKFIFLWRANFVGTASNPAEKNRAKPEKQKGKKEGGWGEGIFAFLRLRLERFRFSLNKRNTKQKNFLFLLKEKIAREKIKKCRENFSVLVPPKRSGGGRKRTSLFWILFKKCSNIVQKTPPR